MRPLLNPALRRLWRDQETVQLGVDPARAFVLPGLSADVARVLDLLDGSRDRSAVLEEAVAAGAEPAGAIRALDLLAGGGALVPGPSAEGLSETVRDDRDRLGPDLSAWSLAHAPRAAHEVLAVRRRTRFAVLGGGRVGAPLAATLAAAGVGRVAVIDSEAASLADCAVGGLCAADAGSSREAGARAAIRQAAPRADNRPRQEGEVFDLVLMAPSDGLGSSAGDELVRTGVAHLVARIRELTGIGGPLVVPGRSSCLRCHDLHRTDRDPQWPVLAAQLATPSRQPEPCDAALASAVVGLAALQALAFLDRSAPAASPDRTAQPAACFDATLELTVPDWRARRRSWTPHPGCGCIWPVAS